MRIRKYGQKSCHAIIHESGIEEFISYQTTVAFNYRGQVIATEQKWSPTTSKHIGLFSREGRGRVLIPQHGIERLKLVANNRELFERVLADYMPVNQVSY